MVFTLTGYSQELSKQEKKRQKKEAKAAKKAQKNQASLEKVNRINELIELKEWVLEGTSVANKKGEQIRDLNSNLNFAYVKGEEAVVQLSFVNIPNWDGIPQLTVKGRVARYEIQSAGEDKPSSLRVSVVSPTGNADIFLTFNTNNGTMTVSGKWGERITMRGDIKHPDESFIYKGATRIGN